MTTEPWYKIPEVNYPNKTVAIIGGGLAGTSCAFSFAKRGWQVTLIEKSKNLAAGASGNDVGIITPLISHESDIVGQFYLQGFHHTLSHIKELKEKFPELLWKQCGALEKTPAKLEKDITKTSIKNLSTKINDNSLFIEECAYTSPPQICAANINYYAENISVILDNEIQSIKYGGEQWHAIGKNNKTISQSDVLIVANANSIKQFEQTSWLAPCPVAGQITAIKSNNYNVDNILCYQGGYATPQINGNIYTGATFRRGDEIAQIEEVDNDENIKNLINNYNIEEYQVVSARASIRATLQDRRPAIGMVPDYHEFNNTYKSFQTHNHKIYPDGKYINGLYISAGHGSRGLISCSIAGEIIAAMANNQAPFVTTQMAKSINPARFIIRTLKRS